MLIINLKKTDYSNSRGRFFKKQIRPDPFARESKIICGLRCNYLEFDESAIHTFNLERLMNTFKGRIIGSPSALEMIVSDEYRFDYRPYFKRASLSALINSVGRDISNVTVSVKDNAFVFSHEYLVLANAVKSFSLISEETPETKKLSDKCFIEFGNFIRVSDKTNYNHDVIIDFKNLDDDCKIMILKQGREQLLYPDPRYFLMNDELLPLVNMGINPRVLCAAFTVVA